MARTESEARAPQYIAEDSEEMNTMADAVSYLDAYKAEVSENALEVARQVGYDGPMTIGSVEDGIRMYARRTIDDVIELGKRFLILKELTHHGEFTARVETLGFGYQTVKKFMAATVKFSKGYSNTRLAAGTQTKMLELLVLDDGEIEALDSGDTVRGVTLDKIETMSVSELKKALRDANERIEAKDAVIKDKSAKIDTQAETIASLAAKKQKADAEPVSIDQALVDARSNVQITALAIKMDVMSRLMKQVAELMALDKGQGNYAGALVIDIKRELDIVAGDCGLPTVIDDNPVPEWMRPGALDGLDEQFSNSPSGFELPDED